MPVRRAPFVLALFVAVLSVACVSVPAYDRGLLAHRSMTPGDLAPPSESHVRAVHEGAVGGGFAAGGGCGCN
jgi:hypothetical protein